MFVMLFPSCVMISGMNSILTWGPHANTHSASSLPTFDATFGINLSWIDGSTCYFLINIFIILRDVTERNFCPGSGFVNSRWQKAGIKRTKCVSKAFARRFKQGIGIGRNPVE